MRVHNSPPGFRRRLLTIAYRRAEAMNFFLRGLRGQTERGSIRFIPLAWNGIQNATHSPGLLRFYPFDWKTLLYLSQILPRDADKHNQVLRSRSHCVNSLCIDSRITANDIGIDCRKLFSTQELLDQLKHQTCNYWNRLLAIIDDH